MSRREKVVTITAENRDHGKTFRIVEMSAEQACEWFDRAAQLIGRGGADVPATLFEHGPAGFVVLSMGAILSALGKAPYHEVKPLLDELMVCVVSMRSPGAAADLTNASLISGQIEEISTRYLLREEVLSTILGFSIRERLSTFREAAAAMMSDLGLNIPTSDEKSESSSQAGSPPGSN
jgi:hypothetical protein